MLKWRPARSVHTVDMFAVCVCADICPVFQECIALIRRLCVEEAAGGELADKLTENLKEVLSDNKVSAACDGRPEGWSPSHSG